MKIFLVLLVASMMRTYAYGATSSTTSVSAYDEDLTLSFEQNISNIAFNVTAVAQCGNNGSSPFYSVVGLSNSGYWYEVGIAWNWPSSFNPISVYAGFHAIYHVFGWVAESITQLVR